MPQTTSNPAISFNHSVATVYEQVLGPPFFEPYAIETANRVAALQPQMVLETACGTGRLTRHLCKMLADSATLIATDISKDMLAIAKEKVAAKNIYWQPVDALYLPFDDNYFDVVVCQFGAMFFPDRVKGFSEALRVLRTGGTFIVSVWDKLEYNPVTAAGRQILKDFFGNNPPKMMNTAFSMADKKEIAALLAECRFRNVEFETVNKNCIVESAEAFAAAIVEGSTNTPFILERDASAVPVLKKKITETLREKFGDYPVKGTMQAIIVKAEK